MYLDYPILRLIGSDYKPPVNSQVFSLDTAEEFPRSRRSTALTPQLTLVATLVRLVRVLWCHSRTSHAMCGALGFAAFALQKSVLLIDTIYVL